MAWPATLVDGNVFNAAAINPWLTGITAWAGNVNGNHYAVSNLAITETSGASSTLAVVGIVSPVLSGGATVATAIGVQIAAQKVTGVTTGYGIYQSGASDANYFAGYVGIGTATPRTTLDVAGPVFCATQLSLSGTAKSTVANTALIITSTDVSNPLNALVELITDPTASNRRLAVGCVEQSIAWRNVTLAESGGNVGIGTTTPTISGTGKFHHSGDTARVVDAANAPANSSAAGNDGEVRMSGSNLYFHMGGQWLKLVGSTF